MTLTSTTYHIHKNSPVQRNTHQIIIFVGSVTEAPPYRGTFKRCWSRQAGNEALRNSTSHAGRGSPTRNVHTTRRCGPWDRVYFKGYLAEERAVVHGVLLALDRQVVGLGLQEAGSRVKTLTLDTNHGGRLRRSNPSDSGQQVRLWWPAALLPSKVKRETTCSLRVEPKPLP